MSLIFDENGQHNQYTPNMTEVPAATPEKLPQLPPYEAKYDDGPTLLPEHMSRKVGGKEIRAMFSDVFMDLVDTELPQLLSMRPTPSEITAEDVKVWLGSTLMRYHEEPSEILPATVKELREKASRLISNQQISQLTSLIDALEMPWGYDEFGKQQELRRIWENEVSSGLKNSGLSDTVANSVHDLGGYFSLGRAVQRIPGFVELLSDQPKIGDVDPEFTDDGSVEFRERVERCDTYADRLMLLKAHRAKLLSFLQEYIRAQLALLEQQRAKVNAELNEMLVNLGRRPAENTGNAEVPPDIP